MEENGLGSLQELSEAEDFHFKHAAVNFFFFFLHGSNGFIRNLNQLSF